MSSSSLLPDTEHRVPLLDGTHSMYMTTMVPSLFEAGPVDAYATLLGELRAEFRDGLVPAGHPTLRALEVLRVQIRRARAWSAVLGQLDLHDLALLHDGPDSAWGDDASHEEWRLHLAAEQAARASCDLGMRRHRGAA